MAQSALNSGSKWRGAHHNTCPSNDLVNGRIHRAGLTNGVIVRRGWSAGECTPLGMLYGSKPPCINGYINHDYKGKSTKAAPPEKFRTKDSTLSVVTNGSAGEKIRSTDVPDVTATNGALSGTFDQAVPEPNLTAPQKKQRKKKLRYNKKRRDEVASQDGSALPPQEKEDWESEIQEVTLSGWEKTCFGLEPYGPEDIFRYALRDMRLEHKGAVDLPLTASYRPAKRHPRPIRWTCTRLPTEPDQFADADE